MRSLVTILFLVFLQITFTGCGTEHSSSLRQEADVTTNSVLDIFTMDGSSNTSGQGATFRYEQRLEHHLTKNHAQLLSTLTGKRIFASLDYFFPTNLPEFYDDNKSVEDFENAVKIKVQKLLEQGYDAYFLSNLPDLNILRRDYKDRAYNEKALTPLKVIHEAISSNDIRRRKLLILNAVLTELDAPNVHIMDMNRSLLVPVLSNQLPESTYYTKNLTTLFAPDQIHFNDRGQAMVFNLLLKPHFERVLFPGQKITPMALDDKSPWQREISIMFFGASANNASQSGVSFIESLNNAKFLVKASDASLLSIAKSTIHTPTNANGTAIAKSLASLQTVQYVIDAVNSKSEPTSIELSLSTLSDGRKNIGLDFDKLFKYTYTNLKETQPGSRVLTASGSDFFTSAVKGSLASWIAGLDKQKLLDYTPHYWYHFAITPHPENSGAINIRWLLIPPFKDTQGKTHTPPNKERLEGINNTLTRQAIEDVANGSLEVPYLEYNFILERVGF